MTTEEIRKLLEEGKLIIGHNETVHALESGSAAKVLLAQNAPAAQRGVVEEYAQMQKTPVVALEVSNTALGTVCRKPFAISFIAVRQ